MKKPINILFLTRLFYPQIGGVEKHVFEISKRLIRMGYEVTIITEKNSTHQLSEKSLDKEVYEGITIYRIPITTSEKIKKFQIWKWFRSHRKLLQDADLIHAHDVFYWYLPFRFLYPAKKVYTTFHGYESYPIKRKAVVYRKIFEFLSNGSICVGSFMKKWYKASPSLITYGAVNSHKLVSKPKNNSAIFIGRLDEQTNIQMYADVVGKIRRHIPDFSLTIYGDGPLKEQIKGEGIKIKGFDLRAEKKIGEYEIAFVSRYLSILEAMAAKRLVFALYDNPVKEDYLKMSPFKDWIIISNSSEDLANEVIYYLTHKREAEKKVTKSYDWVREQSWEKMVGLYFGLWNIN